MVDDHDISGCPGSLELEDDLLLERVHHSSKHVWQGTYIYYPLDDLHLRKALRSTELNPVGAGLAAGSDYCVAANNEMRGTLICFSRLRVWAMS
jgi:hypothetical protein